MSELTKTNKPQENIEENQLSSESESGTSSWESEPVTQRTTRQYYPVRESSRESEPTAQDGQLQEISDSEMGRKEKETLGGSYGGFSDELGSAERSDGSKEGSLQNGIPIDGYTGFDGDVLSLSSHLRHVSGETESGKERNETGDSASSDDDHASGGWEEGEKQDRDEDDDEIEEIDLTRDPLESKYLHRNIGESYVPTSNVLFLPSLSSLGSLGPASLGAVMGDLLGQAAGLDMGEDTGSDWVEEEVEGDSDEREREEGVAEEGREPSSQEGLAQLFQTLKQQHEEQMRAQQMQHRTQISWLKNQLLTGGKTDSSHSHDMGSKAASHTRPHVQGAVKREGENKSQEKGDLLAPGRVDIEEVPLLDQGDDSSSETSTFVSGSLDNTQMTTWSDVHDQKQGQNESNVDQFVESGVAMPEGAILERMQQNFEDQRAAMQREYQAQVASLQREWHALQQRQTQQRQVVVDLLQQQDNRLQQQQASLAQSQQQDADDMSSVYSDFTYWRLEEGDTYKDLPTSHSRGEQPHSVERDSLASEEPPIVATDTPVQGGVESSNREGEVPGFHEGGMAKLVQSPRTSSRGKSKQAPPRSPQSSASSRIDLQEKYSRHIADLEAYYEGELDDLRKQLAQARLASSVVTERGMEKGPHPATTERGGGGGAEKLQLRCQQLQTSLTAANSRIQDLENTVQALEDRLLEWPDRYSLANSTVEVLQKRADDLVRLVKQREEDFRKLEQENRTLQHSLLQAQQLQELQTTEGKKEQAMLGKLIAQYTNLTAQHEATQAELFKVQMNLSEANASISELKRTAVRQELEIKQLEGEKKKLLTPRDRPLTNSSFSSPLPLDVEPTSSPGYAKGHHDNDRVLGAQRTKTPTTPQATPAYPTSNSPLTPGSAMRLSVEDRKFLRSADFNIFTGEDPRTSSTSTSQSPFSIPSDLRTTHSTSYKAPDVISPVQNSTTSPPSNSLVPPFDSDLDDRPLSPMMKASAQFDRWKSSGQSPRSRTSRTHPGSFNSSPGSQLHASEAPTRDTSSGERTNSVAQPVLYSRRSRDSAPLSSGGSSSAGTGKEVRGESTRHDVKSASPVGQAVSFPTVRTGKKTNYERASTIGDHLQPGVNAGVNAGVNGGDPSLHVWAVHRSPNTAQLNGKQHRSKSSPRQQTAASAPAHSLSPGQAARRNLAKYSVKDALGGSGGEKGRKRSSPRRSLASSFKASEEKGSSSPPREGGLRKGEMSSKSVQTPTTNEDPLEAALQNVREGHVITRAEWENGFAEAKKSANKNASRMTSKTSDTPEAILQRLSKESKKLDALMLEKRNLEASLSHLPTSGPACAKKVRKQERLEERLDQVTREMGSVRMLLRKYNALNISF